MTSWLLAFSYWIHLITTVLWLGGLALLALVAWPAWQQQTLTQNQWIALQMKFAPWVNGSMLLLWVTGFVQMTNDGNYNGFMVIDSTWAVAMLLKHVAVVAMTVLGLWVQMRIHPQMASVALLKARSPQVAEAEMAQLSRQEIRLLRLNLVAAALVLLCTGVATAV
jgi:uncharacterized membrane protein